MTETHALPPIGEWLSSSFVALGRRWWTLTALALSGTLVAVLGAAAVYALAGACVYFFTDKAVLAQYTSPEGMEALAANPNMGMLLFLVNVLAFAVALRLACWFLLASIHVASDLSLGYWEAIKLAKERSRAFTILFFVTHTVVQVGWALFIIPGLVLSVFLGFAPFAFVREKAGVWQAMRRSWQTASGHFWGILGRMVVLGLVCLAIGIVPILGWIAAPCLAYLAWAELHRQLTTRQPAVATARPRPGPIPPGPRATQDPTVTIERKVPKRPDGGPNQPEYPG